MRVSPGCPPAVAPCGDGGGACGFLALDKPAGLTSHDCVSRARRAYGLRRVGHGGTLDPQVTGVLPLALGKATRLLPYLSGPKSYRGLIQLGIRTISDDMEGEVLQRRPVPELAAAELERALAPFRGPIRQRPPQVSALHVRGERAHVRIRRGETLELAERQVTVHALELDGWDPERAQIRLRIDCSAGTYIRALARDLGEELGCGGALAELRRTATLGFRLEQAVSLDALAHSPPPPLLDPLAVLGHLPQRRLAEIEWPAWRCGRSLADGMGTDAGQAVAILTGAGRLAGIACGDGQGLLQPRLVLDGAG